ncbi:hypothetical protein [Salegentibacter mishustinae]|uniref:hypothetical protein n=1 Tax=Salegentibacter mishustinae TaxID=270918 RepID=UPI00070D34B5|nr:hypothetical protein [Salegentibacter mishustinae]PNW20740.1 hypothetical protein APB85_05505 [Salegentibacter mishustinae]
MKRCKSDACCNPSVIKACGKICIKATNSEYNKREKPPVISSFFDELMQDRNKTSNTGDFQPHRFRITLSSKIKRCGDLNLYDSIQWENEKKWKTQKHQKAGKKPVIFAS